MRNPLPEQGASTVVRASEARLILREAEAWQTEGLITPAQRAALATRYAPAAQSGEAGAMSLVLQALGGLVLGAAAIALIVFVEPEENSIHLWLLGSAFVLAAAGAALVALRGPFGDAALVAALVPATWAGVRANLSLASLLLPPLFPLAVALWRRGVPFVPPLAAISFAVATGISLAAFATSGEWSLTYLTVVVAAALAAGWYAGRARGGWDAASGLLVVAVALGVVFFYFDYDLSLGDGAPELMVGAAMAIALALAVPFRRRGALIGATVALAVDAVVFAFDVGGLLFGVLTLLAVAGALLAAAGAVRRFLEDSG